MHVLIRDQSLRAHQLVQLKYGMLNFCILAQSDAYFLIFPLLQICLGFMGSKKQSAVLFDFNNRSPVSSSILVLNYLSTKYK